MIQSLSSSCHSYETELDCGDENIKNKSQPVFVS